jgi:hypothetical protein
MRANVIERLSRLTALHRFRLGRIFSTSARVLVSGMSLSPLGFGAGLSLVSRVGFSFGFPACFAVSGFLGFVPFAIIASGSAFKLGCCSS